MRIKRRWGLGRGSSGGPVWLVLSEGGGRGGGVEGGHPWGAYIEGVGNSHVGQAAQAERGGEDGKQQLVTTCRRRTA